MRCFIIILLIVLGQAHTTAQTGHERLHHIYSTDSIISILTAELKTSLSDDERIEIQHTLAQKYLSQSRYSRAEKILSQIDIESLRKDDRMYLKILSTRANLEKYKGNYDRAIKYYLLVDTLASQSEKYSDQLINLIDLGEYYRTIGEYNLATKSIDRALVIYDNHNLSDTGALIRIYSRYAAISQETQQTDQFYDHINLALDLSKLYGDKYAEGTLLNELGFSYKNQKKTDSSVMMYKRAEELFFSIGANREAIHSMTNRAMAYSHNEDTITYPRSIVISLCQDILAAVKRLNVNYSLTNVYEYLYVSYLHRKDSLSAFKYMQKHYIQALEDQSRTSRHLAKEISEKYENEKIAQQVNLVSQELDKTESHLEVKKEENKRIILFLIVVGVLALVIIMLLGSFIRINRQLKFRSQEKDVLLREIHHRVKNNLQIIHSLLELQTEKVDEAIIPIMIEGQNRVKSMGLIHKMLYQKNDFKEVDFQTYAEELCTMIHQVFNFQGAKINHVITANKIHFDIDTAIPIGLILNELVTNSYKYGFVEGQDLIVQINLEKTTDQDYVLTVSDNGPGLTVDYELKDSSSLGLKLVSTLAQQLGGEFEFGNNVRNHFYIYFKDTLSRKMID